LSQTRLQEPTLGGLARELKGTLVGGPRRLGQAEPSLHVGACGVGEMVIVEATLLQYRVDAREPGHGPIAHADSGCAVEGPYRRGIDAEEYIVECDDLSPVGFANAGRLGVNGRDGRLQEVGSETARGQRALDQALGFSDQSAVP